MSELLRRASELVLTVGSAVVAGMFCAWVITQLEPKRKRIKTVDDFPEWRVYYTTWSGRLRQKSPTLDPDREGEGR